MFHEFSFLTGLPHQLFLNLIPLIIGLCYLPFSLLVTGHARTVSPALVISRILTASNKRFLLFILSLPVSGVNLRQSKHHHKQKQYQQKQQHNDYLPHNISPRIFYFFYFCYSFYYYFEYSLPPKSNSSPTPKGADRRYSTGNHASLAHSLLPVSRHLYKSEYSHLFPNYFRFRSKSFWHFTPRFLALFRKRLP